ncbi:hypothetical protein E1212_10500 [Jiangella ureilytica]|uniref:Uncharacterized protein n=1 Tax=Jiangella ureilytica TaxID=2530374 RepID=A0A4R4RR34_9ACTN|nr:DUF6069 family protein [Jiangella ureilytica]TDC52026.1 hypothetical protein E1212_10500 [Jiangella ureilytica]
MTTQEITTSRPVRQRGVLAVAGAMAAAAVPWVVAEIAGTDLEVTTGGWTMDVGLPLVLGAALVVSLAGWGLLALLQRRRPDARRVWTIVAVTVLLLSLMGPLTADATTAARVYLAHMHLAVGLVLIPGLRRAAARP